MRQVSSYHTCAKFDYFTAAYLSILFNVVQENQSEQNPPQRSFGSQWASDNFLLNLVIYLKVSNVYNCNAIDIYRFKAY